MTNARRKGVAGEKEWTYVLRKQGYEARRSQQHKGAKDAPDVLSTGPIRSWEVKRRESFNLHDAVEQARAEAEGVLCPVAHRKNDRRWLVTMDAEDFFRLVTERNETI